MPAGKGVKKRGSRAWIISFHLVEREGSKDRIIAAPPPLEFSANWINERMKSHREFGNHPRGLEDSLYGYLHEQAKKAGVLTPSQSRQGHVG